MIVMILVGNEMKFTIAAGLIRLHMSGGNEVCNEGERAFVTMLSMPITGTGFSWFH